MDRVGAVATVTVDRPDAMNALDRPTLEELRDRLAEVFTPGAPMSDIVEFLRARVPA